MSIIIPIMLCSSTYVFTSIINKCTFYDICKNFADDGYKLKYNRIDKYSKNYFINRFLCNSKIGLYLFPIPIVNMINAMRMNKKINRKINSLFDNLRVNGYIERMNKLEIEEYKKKETGYNAYKSQREVERRMNMAKVLEYNDKDGVGEILYDMDKETENITILKVTGNAIYLNEYDLVDKIEESQSKGKVRVRRR